MCLFWINFDKKKQTSYTEKYQDHIPCIFAYKVICIVDKFSKPIVFCREENAINN